MLEWLAQKKSPLSPMKQCKGGVVTLHFGSMKPSRKWELGKRPNANIRPHFFLKVQFFQTKYWDIVVCKVSLFIYFWVEPSLLWRKFTKETIKIWELFKICGWYMGWSRMVQSKSWFQIFLMKQICHQILELTLPHTFKFLQPNW